MPEQNETGTSPTPDHRDIKASAVVPPDTKPQVVSARPTDAETSLGLKRTHAIVEQFRRDFQLDLDDQGVLHSEPTESQLAALHDWHESTSDGSIIMPTEDTFASKVILARALMPQVNEAGEIQYLFGKGVGIELSLQGDVEGRSKKQTNAPYRTHSDFEIYGATSTDYDDIPHSDRFRAVFGAQELYPVTRTKGLVDLPPELLRDTAETVNVDGISFLVPKLEVQFVDKFEKANESIERQLRSKTDAEWLASLYPLDAELIHTLLDDYVIAPEVAKLEPVGEVADQTATILERKIAQAVRRSRREQEDTEVSIADVITQDHFLTAFYEDKGIENIEAIIDPITGTIRDDGLVYLAVIEQRRQTGIREALQDKHRQIGTVLSNN